MKTHVKRVKSGSLLSEPERRYYILLTVKLLSHCLNKSHGVHECHDSNVIM